MTAKKLMILVLAMALIMAIPAVLFASSGAEGEAEAESPTEIEADFKFQDDGTTLTITGTAEGLTPSRTYRSLIYGIGSLVEGINSCEPPSPNTLSGAQMFVGFWAVATDGTGTLGPVTKTGTGYAALNTIGTISVRGGGSAPVVVACGEVEED